jgi:hypothetical protein
MTLKAVHDSIDEIGEQYRDLYTEKNGKYELTGIQGVKTEADVARVQTALEKERTDHKETRDRLGVWGDLDHEEVMGKLDRFPELEAASKGNLDEAEIEKIVQRRVEGTINSQVAPLERQLKQLTKERDEVVQTRDNLLGEKRQRVIHDNVRTALTAAKVVPEAFDDALMLAERVFEIRDDDSAVVTRDNVGVTPGIAADVWLQELQERRPHWWPGSQGGGARGTGPGTGGMYADNPWSHENWNMTAQGRVVREKGMERAEAMAKAAGTTVGGQRPPAKK